jgi:hypothetical protein
MFFDINKPNPVPPVSDVTANFENSFGNTSHELKIKKFYVMSLHSWKRNSRWEYPSQI